MERVFIKTMGMYKAWSLHDWPWPTWQHIADHLNIKVSDFSRPVEESILSQYEKRPRN